jgi:hypothetical protein
MPPFSPSVERDNAAPPPPLDLEDYLRNVGSDYQQGQDRNYVADERPTFGARIAGDVPAYPKVYPSIPKAPTDNSPAPAPPVQYDPGKVPEGIFAPKSPPLAPVGANNPALVSLLNRQAKDSQRINPYQTDPQTGKRTTLPQYRMGTGMRIVGSIANFASGFGGKGPVAYVGPGATNARYQQDEAQRQANLASDELQIKGQQGLDTENLKLEREAQRQAYEGITGEARKTAADAQQSRADAYQQLADTRQQLADLQSGKSSKVTQDANDRSALADQMGLKGNERRDYILTGKLPKDFTGRQPTDLETWMQAFKRDNGRPPSADEIAMRKARTRGTPAQFSKVEGDKKSSLMKAEKQYREDKLAGDPDAEKNLNLAKQVAQESYEQQIQALGGSVAGRNQAGNTSGQIQVTDPRGKIHTFRDQKSADGFKKAAGIR